MSTPLTLVYNIPLISTILTLPINDGGNFTGTISSIVWGDGSTSGSLETHTYATASTFTVEIYGSGFTNLDNRDNSSRYHLTQCTDFGTIGLTSLEGAFYGALNLTSVPAVLPSTIVNLASTFADAGPFNDVNVTYWDTSNVSNMGAMFSGAGAFNQDISSWNVTKVTNASYMFAYCSAFNQDLGGWVLSGGNSGFVNCSHMFSNCIAFNNGDIAGGTTKPLFTSQNNTGTITNFSGMFAGAIVFNQDISTWKYTAIIYATNFLSGAKRFSITNYNNLLVALGTAIPSLPNGIPFTNTGLFYYGSAAVNARNTLLNTYTWTIGGDVLISQNPPIQNAPFTVTLSGSSAALSGATPPLLPVIGHALAMKTKSSGLLSPSVYYTTAAGIDTLVITNVIIPTSGLIAGLSIVDVDASNVDVVSLNRLQVQEAAAARTPCFLEGSQILCFIDDKETYLPIEQMKPGTLVKTLLNGYKKVVLIGKGTIENPASNERLKNRLYTCPTANYPELTNDLVLTGCHSILVEEITDVQRAETMRLLGRMFATDDKYRLMACIDERANPLTTAGTYTIWHFALEHDDQFMNYGVFANGGLLVETCSQRNMRNNSNLVIQ